MLYEKRSCLISYTNGIIWYTLPVSYKIKCKYILLLPLLTDFFKEFINVI